MTRQEAQQRLNIEVDLIPKGLSNRPGTPLTPTHITIHNTGNPAPGADARMHARYVKGADARARQVSWHYTVDDQRCIKHLPTSEKGLHAKSGNSKSIGIEVCEHAGINKPAAIDRAALLTAVLMAALEIPPGHIVPHQFWTGKDCPHIILREPGGFAAFRAKAAQFLEELGEESVGGPGLAGLVEEFAAGGDAADAAILDDEMGTEARVAALERLVGQLMVENQQLKELTRGAREDEQEAMCATPTAATQSPGVATLPSGTVAGHPAEIPEPSAEKLRDALDSIGSPEQVRVKIEERDVGSSLNESVTVAAGATAPAERRRELLARMPDVVRKVREQGEEAELDEEEEFLAEAIVLFFGRPALLIQNGSFADPGDFTDAATLLAQRTTIEQAVVPSVGRINFKSDLDPRPFAGTGFMVGPELLMTNRHVVEVFGQFSNGTWSIHPEFEVSVNFKEEHEVAGRSEFPITEIVAVHPTDPVDMALLRVGTKARSGSKPAKLPPKLRLAGDGSMIGTGRLIYVVGYPAEDPANPDRQEMLRIFGEVFNVKRLQPGRVKTLVEARPHVRHDCSTLGGNSGSCVLDMATHQVIGLHFSGAHRVANRAVALWKIQNDPLLRDAGVTFD